MPAPARKPGKLTFKDSHRLKELEGLLASLPEDIARHDYNLNIPRYVTTVREVETLNLMDLRRERLSLHARLAALETEMEGYLRDLGSE